MKELNVNKAQLANKHNKILDSATVPIQIAKILIKISRMLKMITIIMDTLKNMLKKVFFAIKNALVNLYQN